MGPVYRLKKAGTPLLDRHTGLKCPYHDFFAGIWQILGGINKVQTGWDVGCHLLALNKKIPNMSLKFVLLFPEPESLEDDAPPPSRPAMAY